MQVRLWFENKNIISFSYTKEKSTAIGFNSDFFAPYFEATLFVCISLCK